MAHYIVTVSKPRQIYLCACTWGTINDILLVDDKEDHNSSPLSDLPETTLRFDFSITSHPRPALPGPYHDARNWLLDQTSLRTFQRAYKNKNRSIGFYSETLQQASSSARKDNKCTLQLFLNLLSCVGPVPQNRFSASLRRRWGDRRPPITLPTALLHTSQLIISHCALSHALLLPSHRA